jgi:glycosyltransferase involved in cell wall biosynthesis
MAKDLRPKISVIMPIYKSSLYLREAISSVVSQSFKDFEFLIIDDNDIKDAEEKAKCRNIIKSFRDKRIKVIDNKGNMGVSASINKVLKIAKGKYIARMDSDDVNTVDRFQKQHDFLENNKAYTLVGSFYESINQEGNIIEKVSLPYKNQSIKIELFQRNPFTGGGVMFRRKTLEKVGLYEFHDNDFSEDYDLWFRLASIGKVYNIPEYLYKYRIYSNNVENKEKISKQLFARERLYLKYRFTKEFFLYFLIFKMRKILRNIVDYVKNK